MCVQETRRQVYVYRKGRWGLCVCMLVRGRVLLINVSENRRKWLREGRRVIWRACLRERHLERECVTMCEIPLMDIHRVRILSLGLSLTHCLTPLFLIDEYDSSRSFYRMPLKVRLDE